MLLLIAAGTSVLWLFLAEREKPKMPLRARQVLLQQEERQHYRV